MYRWFLSLSFFNSFLSFDPIIGTKSKEKRVFPCYPFERAYFFNVIINYPFPLHERVWKEAWKIVSWSEFLLE